jgi:hypothetical protein
MLKKPSRNANLLNIKNLLKNDILFEKIILDHKSPERDPEGLGALPGPISE